MSCKCVNFLGYETKSYSSIFILSIQCVNHLLTTRLDASLSLFFFHYGILFPQEKKIFKQKKKQYQVSAKVMNLVVVNIQPFKYILFFLFIFSVS